MNKKKLLKIEKWRDWKDESAEYSSIIFFATGTKHSSGYSNIAIMGKPVGKEEYEHIARPDDVSMYFPTVIASTYEYAQVRMDCFYPSGIFRYHGPGTFTVGPSLSSVDIKFKPNRK